MTTADDRQLASRSRLVSREFELKSIDRFLESVQGPRCLVISGEPGIGKTTLFDAGIRAATGLGIRVLSHQSGETEATLSFVALADLVNEIGDDTLAALPTGERNALEVAVQRRDPVDPVPDAVSIATGFLSAMRAAAGGRPLLIGLDDAQWLDPASAGALEFMIRRLGRGSIRLLVAHRSDVELPFDAALQTLGAARLTLRGLSLDELDRLITDRVGSIGRPLLERVHETSLGNPLFALELARPLVGGSGVADDEDLPLPRSLDDLFGARVRALAPQDRLVLLTVSVASGISTDELTACVGPEALSSARSSRLLDWTPARVRPAHPLLGSAARQQSSAAERREAHAALAAHIGDPTLRTRHLALATVDPDEEIAELIASEAEAAARRGAAQVAAELGAHALRITPLDSPKNADRLLALGRLHLTAGDLPGLAEVLGEAINDLPSGRPRARAHLMLGEAAEISDEERHIEAALAEAGDEKDLRAVALARRSIIMSISRVEQLDEAEGAAREAVSEAKECDLETRARARAALAWAMVMRGKPIDKQDLRIPLPRTISLYEASLDRPRGVRLAFRGLLSDARQTFRTMINDSGERGEVLSALVAKLQLCELELRAGDVREASRLLEEMRERSPIEQLGTTVPRILALINALAGKWSEAEPQATAVLTVTTSSASLGWDRLEASRALGLIAIGKGDFTCAAGHLGSVWETCIKEHIDDPGAFPVAGDLVEALIETGEVDRAEVVTERLRELSSDQGQPWGNATAARCEAAIRLSASYSPDAVRILETVAADYWALGLRFDEARTLLQLGRAQTEAGHAAEAQATLARAASLFDALGAPGWADTAFSAALPPGSTTVHGPVD